VRPFLLMLGACAAGVLTVAGTSLAGQPVTQTLNPPPPPYEQCKAVGTGTICQGSTDFSYAPIDTALEGPPLVCGSGSSAFDIYDSAVGNSTARRIYDADGNLVKRFRFDQTTDGENINPLTGATVPYTSTLTTVDVLTVPGDLSAATSTTTGHFTVRPPHGAPVFVDVGRTVITYDPNSFSVDFLAGRQDLFDYAFGEAAVLDPLCAALGAS
jgi:hypothetical protein